MNKFCIFCEDVFITTFNAEAMCPKIIISVEGLEFVMTVIFYFTQKKTNWPTKLQLLAVRLILKYNAFQFDEKYFTPIEG